MLAAEEAAVEEHMGLSPEDGGLPEDAPEEIKK